MKRKTLAEGWNGRMALLALMVSALAAGALIPSSAAVLDAIMVQGQLRNSTNDALSGAYNFSFNVYSQATGGTPLYQRNVTNVTVDANGLYSYTLTGMALPFSGNYYLGIHVNGDPEMSPRLNITDAGTVFRSNRTEYLGSYASSYFLNSSSGGMQTVGGNMTITGSLMVGSSGYSGGGLTASSTGHLYIAGSMYISDIQIPVIDLGINGSNTPMVDDLFPIGNSTNRWKAAYIGTGGVFSGGAVRAFAGAGYVNMTSAGAVTASGNMTAYNMTAAGVQIAGTYRTSWPQQSNASSALFSVVDNGTFLKLTGGTMTGNLLANANLTLDTSDLFVDSTTGRVGIGTATPSAVLHIRSPSAAGVIRLEGNGTGTNYAALEMWNLSTNRGWRVAHRTAGSFAAEYYGGSSWSSPIVILTDGNVSIGASGTPYTKLDVGGSVNVTGSIYAASGGLCADSDGSCTPQAGNVSALSVIAATGVSIGGVYRTSWPTGRGNTSIEIWSAADNNTFLKLTGGTMTGNLLLNANLTVDTSDLVVDASTGEVGIGIANPTEKLHVSGGNVKQSAGTPALKGSYSSSTYLDTADSVYVSGKYAYVSALNSGLAIIDVSNPSNPSYISRYDGGYLAGPVSVYVSGDYAYVVSFSSDNFVILDVSNKTGPTFKGEYNPGEYEMNAPYSVYVSGRYAYVASYYSNSLHIIDVSDPTSPRLAGSYKNDTYLSGATSVYVSGRYAYVGCSLGNRLTIIDISNSSGPSYAGSYNSNTYLNNTRKVYVSGRYAYVTSNNTNSLTIIDISNSSSPSYAGNYSSSSYLGGAYGVYVSGRYAYVGSYYSNSLTIIDVSNSSSPSYVANYSGAALNGTSSVFVSGKYAYLTASISDSLIILDISGIDAPSASIGDIAASSIEVSENMDVRGDIYAGSGLVVGPGGILSQGPLSVSSSADAYLRGNLSVGTTSLSQELTVSGDINITQNSNSTYFGSGGRQYYNGTCMIMTGPTSILEVCP